MKSLKLDKKTFLLLLLSTTLVGAIVTMHDITTRQTVSSVSAYSSKEATLELKSQNTLKEFGTASFTEVNGKLLVKVVMEGQPKASVQPLQLQVGACGKAGALKYALNSLSNGKSSTVLDMTLSGLLAQKPLSLNVHPSARDLKSVVACGNL